MEKEKLNFDIRKAWLVLVEELVVRSNHMEDANKVCLKGAEGGLRATDEIYDLLIEEDCKAGDHSYALTIASENFNCLLRVQSTSMEERRILCTKRFIKTEEDDMDPSWEQRLVK